MNLPDDIVTRLREAGDCPTPLRAYLARAVVLQAADEIELLRSTVTDCRIEIERLTAERDEARRMYCKAVADHYEYACNAELDGAGPYTQKDVAKDEGWDCFKEDGK